MQSWQVDRIKEKVDEMAGELNIRIYTADDDRYKIWYNSRDDVALYARVTWDKQNHREKMNKAWVGDFVDAINKKSTRICVRYRNSTKQMAWFGPEHDMKPVNAAYAYIMAFKKRDTTANNPKEQAAVKESTSAKKKS